MSRPLPPIRKVPRPMPPAASGDLFAAAGIASSPEPAPPAPKRSLLGGLSRASADESENPSTEPASPAPVEAPPPRPRGSLLGGLSRVAASEPEAPPVLDSEAQASGSLEGELVGKVKRFIYNTDSFKVLLLTVGREEKRLTTKFPINCVIGDKVVAKGKWETYKGQQSFNATQVVAEIPKDAVGIVAWIRAGAVSGVGPATAERLAKHFGSELKNVIGDGTRLAEAGIPPFKAESIAEAWNTNASNPETIAFLGGLGLGPLTIRKIMVRYGAAARAKIEQNPWQLAETIDGIGFETADQIGLRHGHEPTSPNRIKAALRSALRNAVNQDGHCGLPLDELVSKAVALVRLDEATVRAQVERALDGENAIFDESTGLAAPFGIHQSESEFAGKINTLLDYPGNDPEDVAKAIAKAEVDMGLTLDDSQRAAATTALTNNVSVITGGPGTGKSTTLKVVLNALRILKREVATAAPTGRAAKRVAEVTGEPASTCHRLLMFQNGDAGNQPSFDADNPFKENWFVIDEFSMVDVRLGHSFIQAIPDGAGLTIVGDVDQLPSVGPGQLLRDVIASGAVPTSRLNVVHRQGSDSGIVTAAHRINTGVYPLGEGERLNGFGMFRRSNARETIESVVDLVSRRLPERGIDPLKDIQVLTAQRRGEYGVHALNAAIKAAINPAFPEDGKSVTFGERTFSVGDRVMQMRNDYMKSVFNGEVGTVCAVGTTSPKDDPEADKNAKPESYFVVDFSGHEAVYKARDLEDIEQAYAATVHKSQGCEFPVVIFVCPSAHAHMLNRNLFYTAVTRAKRLCMVVGDNEAVRRSVDTADATIRHTGLKTMLLAGQHPAPAPALGRFVQVEE